MLGYEIGLFLAVVAIGVIGYFIGLSVGQERGYSRGFIQAKNEATAQWFENIPPARKRPTSDHEKAGYDWPRSNVALNVPKRPSKDQHGDHGFGAH